MVGTGNLDNVQFADASSMGTQNPPEDQYQQQHNDTPQPNMDPPPGYPPSEPSEPTAPYEQPQPRSFVNPDAPTWEQQPGAPPPAYAPPPPYHHNSYPPHPAAAPGPYSQQNQQPQYYHHPQYPQQQYGGSPYNNTPGPTRPAPGYPPQQQAPQRPGSPLGQPPMAPAPFAMGRAGIMLRPELGPPVPWTTDIFGFLQDCNGCILSFLAPCITFGQIAEIVDTGYTRCFTAAVIYALALSLGVPCLYSYTYRTRMRRHFNLRPDPLDDLCTHVFCEVCALSQEYRELRYRGIDPTLGYEMQRAIITQAMDNPVAPMNAPGAMNMTK